MLLLVIAPVPDPDKNNGGNNSTLTNVALYQHKAKTRFVPRVRFVIISENTLCLTVMTLSHMTYNLNGSIKYRYLVTQMLKNTVQLKCFRQP